MPSPQPVKNRPSRVCPLSHPSQALPSPIPRLLSRPRCAWRWGALAGLPQRAGHAGRAMDGVGPPAGDAGGRAAGVAAPQGRLNFLLCCRCCQALLRIFLPCILWALCHLAPSGLAASLGVGTSRLQRPAHRAGFNTLHPSLDASFDDRRQACGRCPHLFYDGLLHRPGMPTGRLHQPLGTGVTPHRHTAYASLRTAPSGQTLVSRKHQSAMSNLRLRISMRVRAPPLHAA